jgi:signal transduction histidine kinase
MPNSILWGNLARGTLFCAGMIGGATAGNLFYLERFMAGSSMLVLTATFLFYAMSDLTRAREDDELTGALDETQRALPELVLLLADSMVESYKHIGRTMPCTQVELNKLEDQLMPLLNSLKIPWKERERIAQEIDKLKTRYRQEEGRRALTSGRL